MISPSQILLTSLILVVIFRTLTAYKRNKLSLSFVILWLSFWLGVIILVFQQDLVSIVANSLGISRGVDLVIYVSLIVIFYTIYRILITLSEYQKMITKLVREVSLKNAKKK